MWTLQGAPWQTRFPIPINLVHQHKSVAAMQAAMKLDPAGRNSKGKSERHRERHSVRETVRERMEGTLHRSALSPINLTFATCVYVSVGNPARQFQHAVLWGVAGRMWMGWARNLKKRRWRTKFYYCATTVKIGYLKSKKVMPTYLISKK